MNDNSEVFFRLLITFPIFLFSLSVHELAHAITAKWGGDDTANQLGRVTLNPISHIDPIGTILMPLIGALSSVPLIGWAKPVPVNPLRFRRGESYGVIVALAGPFSNLLIALFTVALLQIFIIIINMGVTIPVGLERTLTNFFVYTIMINVGLMCFNMLPFPPLDGSHVLWHWVVKKIPALHEPFFWLQQYGFFALLLLSLIGVLGWLAKITILPIFYLLLSFAQVVQ